MSGLSAGARAALAAAVTPPSYLYFPFGRLAAAVTSRDQALVFQIFSREFPVQPDPIAVVEEVAGSVERAAFGGVRGLKLYARAELDADAQRQIDLIVHALRDDAALMAEYRAAARMAGPSSRERFQHTVRLHKRIMRSAAQRAELSQVLLDAVERLALREHEQLSTVADLLTPAGASATARPP